MQRRAAAVAERCDGVRCDMAMLLLPDVIARTWGEQSRPADGAPPVDDRSGPRRSRACGERHPDFVFMAEVYWDLEWTLQQQGFDYTYDKRLYDRLHAPGRRRRSAAICWPTPIPAAVARASWRTTTSRGRRPRSRPRAPRRRR